jgi:hypothetical protein
MIAFSPDQWHPGKSYATRVMDLFKNTAKEWVRDRCAQLGPL